MCVGTKVNGITLGIPAPPLGLFGASAVLLVEFPFRNPFGTETPYDGSWSSLLVPWLCAWRNDQTQASHLAACGLGRVSEALCTLSISHT